MKAIYKHIAFAALALSAVACSQDDDFAPSYLSDPDAVRITAQVGTADVTGGFTRSNPLGTAEEQAKFNTGDQISVTAGTQAPVTYQLGADGWKPVGETYLKWQTNEMNVTAYYPVGKNDASATTFTVPTEYTDEKPIAEADYMTYSGTQTKGDDKSIDLTMQRKMVRLVITPEFNDQFAKGYSVTTIKVHANTKGYADGEPETGDITVTALKQGDDFYALLAPTTEATAATFLTVTVSDGTTSQELTVKGIPATTAGNSYSFALTVGKDKVAMGTVSVKDWTGATIEGGVAEEVKVETVIEGSTATITVPELATDAMVQNAMNEFTADGLTTIIVEGPLNETRQGYIATALTGKTVTLYLTHLAEDELSEALASADDGITVNCGYYMADASTYVVYNADGLQAWSTNVQANPTTNLSLAKDITLPLAEGETSNWTSVGTETTPYAGTVNGYGHSITGMTINQTTSFAGFIGYLGENGAVKNLKLKDVSVTTTELNAGGLVGNSLSVIENCAVEGGTISASKGQTGGIVGRAEGKSSAPALIVACHNTAAVSGYKNVGGIIGVAYDYSKVIACYNSGTITHTDGVRCGGIVGIFGYSEMYLYCNYNNGTTTYTVAIAGDDSYYGKHNYWSSDHDYANRSNSGEYNNYSATKITSTSEWQTAMTTMNTWLAENAYAYRYVLNTDAATKEAQPLVIVEAPATE